MEKLPPSTPPKYRPHFTWYPLTLEVQGGVMWWRASRSWECFDKYERFWGEQNLLPSKANNYLGK